MATAACDLIQTGLFDSRPPAGGATREGPVRLMVSGATRTMEALARAPSLRGALGAMVTPQTGNSVSRIARWGLPWCADNAAFNAARFSPGAFVAMCERAAAAPAAPLFVCVPDQVGDHACTAYLWERWRRALGGPGGLWGRLPWAFVAQDGLRDVDDVPWGECSALFIGGSDDFKGDVFTTCDLIPEARRRGKWVHMGRVNGRLRLRLACHSEVDSVDGSSLSRFPATWVPRFAGYARETDAERAAIGALLARQRAELGISGNAIKATA